LLAAACAASLFLLAAISAQAEEESPMPKTRSEKIEYAFNELTKDTLDILKEFYAEDVVFRDPLGTIRGREGLIAYYKNMYANVQDIHFDFTDAVVEGDTHVVFWTLRMKVKGLNGGDEVSSDGNSIIRFNADDLVISHRDYFDMGEFIYQHVPVLRWMVGKVNKRLAHSE